jgi:nucleotide-binding universal stress UspA family protein
LTSNIRAIIISKTRKNGPCANGSKYLRRHGRMFERILVPLDGSENAEMVFPYCADLASKFASTVILATVSESATLDIDHLYHTYLKHARKKMRQHLRAWMAPETVTLQSEVLSGDPAHEILRIAEDKDAGLILLASHGSSAEGPWLLGHIAAKVLRATERPVMLIRERATQAALEQRELLRRILVPLDGSKIGEAALCYAVVLAKKAAAEITLIEIFEPVSTVGATGISCSAREDESVRKSLLSYLNHVAEPIKNDGLKVSTAVLFGNAASKIMEYAEKNGIDLIAVSTHGRSGLGRWVFGSVTDKILHTGNVAVLVAHATMEWPGCTA